MLVFYSFNRLLQWNIKLVLCQIPQFLNWLYVLDGNVSPYTQYQYYLLAVNSAGTVTSPSTDVRTTEAPPELVTPPSTRVAPGELFAFYLTWTEPQKPNGRILILLDMAR